MKKVILSTKKKIIRLFPVLIMLNISGCNTSSIPSSKNINWKGIPNDSIFVNFLDLKMPSIIQKEDTIIQVELNYDLKKKKLFLVHKNTHAVIFKSRTYDLAPNNPPIINTLKKTNELTGESITWELLEKNNKQISTENWLEIIDVFHITALDKMPPFINDFVLGGTSISISIYTINNQNTITRHSFNDTLNQILDIFIKYE